MKVLANLAINGVIGYVVGLIVALILSIPVSIVGTIIGIDMDTALIVGSSLGIVCKLAGIIIFEIKKLVDLD